MVPTPPASHRRLRGRDRSAGPRVPRGSVAVARYPSARGQGYGRIRRQGARGPDRVERDQAAGLGARAAGRAGLLAGPPGHPAHGAGGGRGGGGGEPLGARRAAGHAAVLRSEGVASSFIEGLRTPLADVAAAEVGATPSGVASHVADNLGAVVGALGSPGAPAHPGRAPRLAPPAHGGRGRAARGDGRRLPHRAVLGRGHLPPRRRLRAAAARAASRSSWTT